MSRAPFIFMDISFLRGRCPCTVRMIDEARNDEAPAGHRAGRGFELVLVSPARARWPRPRTRSPRPRRSPVALADEGTCAPRDALVSGIPNPRTILQAE